MRSLKIILIISISLMAFLIHSVQNYVESENNQVLISNELYTVWSVELENLADWSHVLDKLANNTRLFLEHDEQAFVRTFFQNGNWRPPMISGAFFSDDDIFVNQAVIGSRHYVSGQSQIEIGGIIYGMLYKPNRVNSVNMSSYFLNFLNL